MRMTSKIIFTPLLFVLASVSNAETYPSKPVRVIVPQPAGSTPDLVARLVAPGLSTKFGHPFIIDNRGGAGGLIGTELAARASADGYTLLIGTPGTLTIMQHVQKNVPYDTLQDFAPIGLISIGPYVLVAHPSLPARKVSELLVLARAEPGKLSYGSAGNGSTHHLAMELFKSMSGINITHIPYKGGPQATTDLIGGHLNLSMLSIAPILPHIRSHRLRVLGVTSATPSPQLPDAPSISQNGVPGYEAFTWFGLLAPAKTPKRILESLSKALSKIMLTPETRSQFERQGVDTAESSPDKLRTLIRHETELYGKLVKLSGMKID